MPTHDVELTAEGYLRLSAEVAHRHFPEGLVVALPRGIELWLLPIRGAAAGGLLLKERNLEGDRSVLVAEALGSSHPAGKRRAFWDEYAGALRIALEPTHEST